MARLVLAAALAVSALSPSSATMMQGPPAEHKAAVPHQQHAVHPGKNGISLAVGHGQRQQKPWKGRKAGGQKEADLAKAVLKAGELKQGQKTKITVFYEALCHECPRKVWSELAAVRSKWSDYVTIELRPWGVSRVLPAGNLSDAYKFWHRGAAAKPHFLCRQGPAGCFANMVHACAIKILPANQEASFIECLALADGMVEDASVSCAKERLIDLRKVRQCVTGPVGQQELVKLAQMTGTQLAEATSLPLVHVDDHPIDMDLPLETVVLKVLKDKRMIVDPPTPDFEDKAVGQISGNLENAIKRT